MNFDLNDDQRMLKDSLDRLIAEPVDAASIGELGLNLLPFAEEDGGLGLGSVEMMLVGEAFGRGLVVEPYLGQVVAVSAALRAVGAGRTIAALIEGTRFAYVDHPALVLGGDTAERFIVIHDDHVCMAEATARRAFTLHNGWSAAAVTIDPGSCERIGGASGVADAVEQATIAWLAANAVGAMTAAFELTAEYLKTREQFGKPIGANQALQHRMAEMLVELEAARSMALYAAQMIEATGTGDRARAFAAIPLVVGKAARFIGQQAVQLHGGIGVADEHRIGHYLKHLTVIDVLSGESDHHAENLAALGGFTGPEPHWESAQ